jgi:hypothetical protein
MMRIGVQRGGTIARSSQDEFAIALNTGSDSSDGKSEFNAIKTM